MIDLWGKDFYLFKNGNKMVLFDVLNYDDFFFIRFVWRYVVWYCIVFNLWWMLVNNDLR